MRLAGKTAIVTGASSGIGRAISLLFAQEGAIVIAADVTTDVVEGGTPVIDELNKVSDKAIFVKADIAKAAEVQALFDDVAKRYGRIDILVNNAVVRGGSSLVDTDEAEWDRVTDVNLKGAYLCLRAAVRQMLTQKIVDEARGRIVNITSQHGMIAAPGDFAYGVSKAGMVYMTKQVASDYGHESIICNAVAPGKILTGKGGRAVDPEMLDYSRSRTPLPRLGKPIDVARAVLFLASAEATYVTGHNLMVDGGWMAR
ncbi:SDR family NAD(P)-dependent oxidoreductase [Neorhizobium alkalisoli]|uniref:NAD(P)-dependent dehydrogenase (Short-subunit alcohol dehydrogenase family) n=1 Tax=Neorhizobium alkalisoli TaxID=528178 RepID=A0A561QGF9_9HYPH|nr:glucose 1-dehydrogenase [Neorhizobium alkalisoli]TWF49426.1 NAD(P)-dependent dehydrogenase (short-subunit alcohol dehydrogenase family) [Neorhizobium alkalisoli]